MAAATVNVNVGVLGHVDSGKTSLVRALSTQFSTASLDKHPQSKERGITLDLGFSAFTTAAPEHLASKLPGLEHVQYTLVDCPGHASLIKTIIGGAQIIDRMLLVVDVTKGIQTQTAECLVIGEILTDDLVVVLNKVDLLDASKREASVEAVRKVVAQALSTTRFKDSPIIPISAIVGGDGKAGVGDSAASAAAALTLADGAAAPPAAPAEKVETMGLDALIELLRKTTVLPDRGDVSGEPLYFAIDHCFPIKGQGTVVTGTVLGGSVAVGQTVEFPQLSVERKVKSMQMFRKPVTEALKGDRVALCLTNLNAKLLERGVVTSPGSIPSTSALLALVRKVKYFPMACHSGSKIHITVGHSTTLAKVTFFGSSDLKELAAGHLGKTLPSDDIDLARDYLFDEELRGGGKAKGGPFLHWALVELEQPIICQAGAMIIGSRLDMNIDTKSCRIAFYGRVSRQFGHQLTAEELAGIKVYKHKERVGVVDRITDKKVAADGKVQSVVAKGMFSKDTDLQRFVGLQVVTEKGEQGEIESSFGKTGKFNVRFRDGAVVSKGSKVILRHKKMVFGPPPAGGKLLQE